PLFLFWRFRCWGRDACRECGDIHFASRGGAGFGLDTLAVNALGLGQIGLGVFSALGGQTRRLRIFCAAGKDYRARRVLLHFQRDVVKNRFGAVVHVGAVRVEVEFCKLLGGWRRRGGSFSVDGG